MSLLAQHLFDKKSRERLREDIQRITEEGRQELKRLLEQQSKALKRRS